MKWKTHSNNVLTKKIAFIKSKTKNIYAEKCFWMENGNLVYLAANFFLEMHNTHPNNKSLKL